MHQFILFCLKQKARTNGTQMVSWNVDSKWPVMVLSYSDNSDEKISSLARCTLNYTKN